MGNKEISYGVKNHKRIIAHRSSLIAAQRSANAPALLMTGDWGAQGGGQAQDATRYDIYTTHHHHWNTFLSVEWIMQFVQSYFVNGNLLVACQLVAIAYSQALQRQRAFRVFETQQSVYNNTYMLSVDFYKQLTCNSTDPRKRFDCPEQFNSSSNIPRRVSEPVRCPRSPGQNS